MPPKKEVKPALKGFKASVPAKDLLPSEMKNIPREQRQIKIPTEFGNIELKPLYESFPEPEEWPGDEVALNFDFGLESDKLFKSTTLPALPSSFSTESKMILWRRPADFVKDLFKDIGSPTIRKTREHSLLNRRATSLLKPFDDQDLEEIKSNSDSKSVKIKVFPTNERDEEEWETELRMKDQANDKNKKKGGKAPQEEEGPIKVKVPYLTDIDMSRNDYSNFSKWVASVLQIIKDRNILDIYTEKPIWTKIFPQNKGTPVYNPSGKYWVKLYFMGKERKIEIDDRFPVNVESFCMLPRSEKVDEIWPMLFSKALLILANHFGNSKDAEIETGQGLFMHALTGLIPQTIKIDDDFQNKIKYIGSLVSDRYYLENTCFLTCYCTPGHKPMIPLASDKKHKFETTQKIQPSPNAKLLTRRNSMYTKDIERAPTNFKPNERSSNIIPGFLYSVTEMFTNDNFNMVYVFKRSDEEMKYRQEYYNLSKTTMHKMSKDEKLEHRKQKKELREKIAEEEKKRIELITKPPIQYKLFKIGSNVKGMQLAKFALPFTETEIFLAKKCIVNKLARPPNYDMPEVKGDDKSMYSQAQSNAVTSGFEIKPLEEFNIPNCKEPIQREEGGNWLTDKDFKLCFHYIQVYFNPKKIKNHSILSCEADANNYLTIDYDHQILKISQRPDDDKANVSSTFLIGYLPQEAKNTDIDPSPSLVLEKIVPENLKSDYIVTLKNKMDSYLQNYEDYQTHFFRILVFSPLNYVIWISSDTEHNSMSMQNFLKDELAFKSNSYNIEHIGIEKNIEYVFAKFSLLSDNESQIFIHVSHTDKSAIAYLKLKFFEIPPENLSVMLDSIEGIEKNLYESEVSVLQMNKFKLNANKKYIMTLEGIFPYNLNENSLQIEIFYNEDQSKLDIEQFEMSEPLEIADHYKGNKYGLIFKEHVFMKAESHCSIYMKLEKKASKENDIEENAIPLKLEVIEDGKTIYWSTGNSQVSLCSIYFKPNRKYYMQCWINKRNLNGESSLCELKDFDWVIRGYSTEQIALVRDTEKEDREAEIMKSWESSQPGRSERAKSARAKFLAKKKLERGEEISEEEQALLKAPRTLPSDKKEEDKGNAKKPPPPKGKAPVKGNAQVEEQKVEQTQVNFPKSKDCYMTEMTLFIERLEEPRVKDHFPEHQGLVTVRNPREKEELANSSLMSSEELISYSRERLQQLRADNISKVNSLIEDVKNSSQSISQEFLENKQSSLKACKDSKKDILNRRELESSLVSLLSSSESVNIEEINKMISENDFLSHYKEIAEKVILKAKFDEIIEKINQSLENFEIEALNEAITFVEEQNLDIDPELYDKATETIEEARINPNFVAEKMAEMKKGGKKPGKK